MSIEVNAFAAFQHELTGSRSEHADFNRSLALSHSTFVLANIHTGTHVADNQLAGLSLLNVPEILQVIVTTYGILEFFLGKVVGSTVGTGEVERSIESVVGRVNLSAERVPAISFRTVTIVGTQTNPFIILAGFGQCERCLKGFDSSIHLLNLSIDCSSGFAVGVIVVGSFDSSYECVVSILRIHGQFVTDHAIGVGIVSHSLSSGGSLRKQSGNGEFLHELLVSSLQLSHGSISSGTLSEFSLSRFESGIESVHRRLGNHGNSGVHFIEHTTLPELGFTEGEVATSGIAGIQFGFDGTEANILVRNGKVNGSEAYAVILLDGLGYSHAPVNRSDTFERPFSSIGVRLVHIVIRTVYGKLDRIVIGVTAALYTLGHLDGQRAGNRFGKFYTEIVELVQTCSESARIPGTVEEG